MTDIPISQLVLFARDWIADQRENLRPFSMELPQAVKAIIEPFYQPSTLDRARITTVTEIENPPFYTELTTYPVDLIDFRQMSGITFVDTVALSQSRRAKDDAQAIRLIFHELVHVAQYECLGVDRFAELYVTGWAANGF